LCPALFKKRASRKPELAKKVKKKPTERAESRNNTTLIRNDIFCRFRQIVRSPILREMQRGGKEFKPGLGTGKTAETRLG